MFYLRISGRFPQIFKFSDEKILYIRLYKCPFFNFGLFNPSESMLNKTDTNIYKLGFYFTDKTLLQ